MSKELTLLQALKEIGKIKENGVYINTTFEYKVLEILLKDYEKSEKNNINEALKRFLIKQCPDVEKKIKALEIIKEVLYISKEDFYYDAETDTHFFMGMKLSENKFDLLKEVLKC